MRVAALYDIHGNLPALEAVVDEVRRSEVDRVVVGGDLFPGPMPCETLDLLLSLDLPIQFLRGNGDREVLARRAGAENPKLPEPVREVIRWVAEQISPEHEVEIAGWPEMLRFEIPSLGEMLFCHATPRNDTEIFTRATPEEQLVPIFADLGVSVVVCGHTHMPFDRNVGAVRVVNAGSVGMPFGKPGADWLLLGPDVEPRHTAYDLEDAAGRIRATGYPQAEDFAARNVLSPPTEDEMLDVFSRVELRT